MRRFVLLLAAIALLVPGSGIAADTTDAQGATSSNSEPKIAQAKRKTKAAARHATSVVKQKAAEAKQKIKGANRRKVKTTVTVGKAPATDRSTGQPRTDR